MDIKFPSTGSHRADWLIVLAVALGLSMACIPVAHADQDSFLKVLGQEGIPVGTPADAKEAVQIGYMACDALYRGESKQAVTTELMNAEMHQGYDDDPRRVARFVDAAHSQLCPDA